MSQEINYLRAMFGQKDHSKRGPKKKQAIRSKKEWLEVWRMKKRPPIDWE